MVRRYNRLLVALYVLTDALLAVWAFILAYGIRFESGLIPVIRGYPPVEQYLHIVPFVAVLTPLAFQLQGVYRLRRGRSRVDDFFAVLIGSILAVVFGVMSTLYVSVYYVSAEEKVQGAYEVSQVVWGLFLVLNVLFTYFSREAVRELLERRWRAGVGLKRILIAGAGDLGRMVADRVLQHREFGFQVVGFVDDRAGGDHIGYRGLPLLGTLAEVGDIAQRERIDHLYVALPLEEHTKLLDLVEITSRECIDVKVVPDLLQFITLRARLEDLDGLPIININDVPLQGFNAWLKRVIDIGLSSASLLVLALPLAVIAAVVRLTSRGSIFYAQERMGLDGKGFTVYKFRSMYEGAETTTGPVWAREDDPRATPIGRWLRKLDLDELPQFWNVLRGDMSIVGPRPERPFFVEQFKHRIPQYMLRHKVKAGITGWAQVNGWRGNTSLEKRIEYDLYYIENWSVTLDLKIMWLTIFRGLFQRV
ncbi:MAG TPA: undecaprenyl-phosphate glucose phosphotransferase [Vicinamibacterales bacterium]|nr:undecaprenyl-phosphate glucose phosphotransferase [Vicinamibacterales bacterium]